MPLYLAYCPDKPNNFDQRMKVRAGHVNASRESKEQGKALFGRAFVDDQHSHHDAEETKKTPAEQAPGMAGSVMIYRYPTIDAAWARIKSDVYWTDDVWDKEKVVVREIIGLEGDDLLKLVMEQK